MFSKLVSPDYLGSLFHGNVYMYLEVHKALNSEGQHREIDILFMKLLRAD
jgi:hypothetical protein